MPKENKNKALVKSTNQFPVVGIGASAGGLDAFKKLLKAIPENSGIAYVLVQHLDPNHESLLPDLLQKVTNIPVLEISDDIKVEPDHIYIIPSNKMLLANDGVLLLSPRPAKSKTERNLPIDLFFTSLAEVHQSHAIGVVLSGTASDGTLGLKAIKDHGGITFAQDEASAAYEGMPHSAVQAGVVDFILPPGKIPEKLLEITTIINGNGYDEQNLPQQDEEVFKQILSLLRIRKGTDFTYYKQTTIRRRILRRMVLNKNEEPAAYLKYLREIKTEQDVLYQDLLIPVTNFFRDSKIFDNLCESVFPQIVKNKTASEPIRIWVAGCSTGQEAYSIAICLKEFLGDYPSSLPQGSGQKVQIFATDMSEPAIVKARAGIYTKSDTEGLTPQRLQEFFTKNNGSYQANKSIRDMCVFAVHNFLKDPPFGKMDFVSCRNVLIYMEPYLQKKALTTFHYALNPKGSLLLGKSETISSVPDLFVQSLLKEGKSDKLFTRKDVPGKFMHAASQRSEQSFSDMNTTAKSENIRTDFQKTADDIMLSRYTPAGVVVNEAMDIVHFRGSTGAYLEPSPGKPSLNLLKMAKEGLAFELRNILHKAKKDNVPVIKENIPVQVNASQRKIAIEAIPLHNTIEPHYLILFHDSVLTSNLKPQISNSKISAKTKKDDKALRIQQLEQELAQTREDMRSITEDQEAANEELQSANEELLSGSEELQSLNEEMETSKEELQSTNEELAIVNQEMVSLNEQVTEAKNYAEAIVATVREPVLVLDKDLRIKSANHSFYQTFQAKEQDTEGVLIYELGNKQWNIPALRVLLEKIISEKERITNFEVKHSFNSIGERRMLLNAREIIREKADEKLILLAIEDVTVEKNAIDKLKESTDLIQFVAEAMPQKVWTALANGSVNYFNQQWFDYTGLKPEELLDSGWKKVIHPDDWKINEMEWQHSIDTGQAFEMEHRFLRHDGEYRWHLSKSLPQKDSEGKILTWVGTNTDIHEQRQRAEEAFVIEFADDFATYKTGEEFFKSLVGYLAGKTRIDYVFIGDLVKNDNDQYSIKTKAITIKGQLVANIEYPLSGEPCEQVIRGSLYSYPRQCRQTFPKNKTLEQYNVEGYIGCPLFDEEGNAKGLIAVMHEKEIDNPVYIASLLRLVAKRAEFEMDRIKHEETLKSNNKVLKEKNLELESFAYVSSHDLQEPLRKIQTFASRILEKEQQNLSSAGKDYFNRMQEAASRMRVLIDDLLVYSRTNSTERKLENTDLGKIVEEVKIELKETIQEKNATIESGEMCEVSIIPFQFHQLFSNLISNSLKFSIPAKPSYIIIKSRVDTGIELNNAMLSPQQRYCHISITDNGIGFDPLYKDRIFEVFQRLHGKEEYAGTGIGLAIVKKIVDNHNGFITATGQLQKGATFDIYIPHDETNERSTTPNS